MNKIDQINQIIETFKTQFEEIIKEKKDYLNTKKEEEFVDNQTIEESELLLQGENILDRKSTEKQRIDNILKLNNEIEQNINRIQEEINKIQLETNETKKWIKEEDRKTINSINETIVTMKEIRQRKADKEKEKSPKRKQIIEEEKQIENNQLEEMLIQYKTEREEIERRREREKQLFEITGFRIKETLFDSNIHKWSKNDSEFSSRLKGHRNIVIVIEDKNNNIFGGYMS